MKKKIISTLLCTAMLATMVAGCGVEKSDGGSDTEGSASSVAEMKGTGDNEINILIYAQDHEKAVYQELIDKFTKEHADEISTVNFEVTTQDEYATKMTAAMTAGELPDIFYVGPEAVRSYVDNGYVQPLDDLVDAVGFVVAAVCEQLLQERRRRGDRRGISGAVWPLQGQDRSPSADGPGRPA